MRRKIAALALASLATFAAGSALAQMPSPEKIHKKWDTNADGGVDKAEWLAAGRKEARFAQADTDGDGKISLGELKTGMSKMKAKRAQQRDANQTPPADH